jgi:hypothetical protein
MIEVKSELEGSGIDAATAKNAAQVDNRLSRVSRRDG